MGQSKREVLDSDERNRFYKDRKIVALEKEVDRLNEIIKSMSGRCGAEGDPQPGFFNGQPLS